MSVSVRYAAAYAYSPRGQSEMSVNSRKIRDLVKSADPGALKSIAKRVLEGFHGGLFPGFFGPDVTLVPIPGRAPIKDQGSLWVAERICNALLAAGLGCEVWPAIRRIHAVQKSAFAAPGGRPDLQTHIDSLRVAAGFPPTTKLLLVDDFVTKGRTILAAAMVLRRAIPSAQVQAFAVVRTMGLVPDVEKIRWPIVGEIQSIGDDASRIPQWLLETVGRIDILRTGRNGSDRRVIVSRRSPYLAAGEQTAAAVG